MIAALAERQHGVVSRRQLLARGFSSRAIGRRIERGRLHPLHRGVYAVGHPLVSTRGRWMAGVLAAGPGAVLSHRSAAAAWALRSYSGEIEVTAARTRSSGGRIRVHESVLAADEVSREEGIPVTTVARTLLDLASVFDRERLQQAVGEAERRLLADSPSLPELIERHRGVRGLATLRAILADARIGLDVPESELEIEFVAFVERRGLPRPELNVWIEAGGRSFRLDCLWRDAKLAVELDSREHHDNSTSFERDRARDMALLAVGLRTTRVTSRRLRLDGDRLERELRLALTDTPAPV